MKKFLLSTVALAGLTAGAVAADLPSRRIAPAPYVAVPVFPWTGFYVGVNAGYGFSGDEATRSLFTANIIGLNAPLGPTVGGGVFGNNNNNRNRDGFVGGGQVGYNYQVGSIVFGVEGDIQYTDFGRGRNNSTSGAFGTFAPSPGLLGAPTGVGAGAQGNVAFFNNNTLGANRSDYFGTVRGRLGYAFDRFLVYGTGGVAFRDVGNNNNNNNGAFGFGVANGLALAGTGFYVNPAATFLGAAVNPSLQRRQDDIGYAVGGGVEYAFTPNLTGKIEGLYVNFDNGRKNGQPFVVGVTNFGSPVSTSGRGRGDDFAVVRAGLNYKFNLF